MNIESRALYIALIVLSIIFSAIIKHSEYNRGMAEGRLEKMEEWKKAAYPDAVFNIPEQIDTTDTAGAKWFY